MSFYKFKGGSGQRPRAFRGGFYRGERSFGVPTPADYPDVVLWLDSTDNSTITLDGSSNVSSWIDKIGSVDFARSTSGITLQTLNGIQVLKFADKNLSGTFSVSQPNTIVMGLQDPSTSGSSTYIDGSSARQLIAVATDYQLYGFAGTVVKTQSSDTLAKVIAVEFNGSASRMIVDYGGGTVNNYSSLGLGANSLNTVVYLGGGGNLGDVIIANTVNATLTQDLISWAKRIL